MFHIDLTFEDCRIIADSINGGQAYITSIYDAVTGEARSLVLTSKQLSMIFALNMDNNGEPEGFEQMYVELEPLFKDWPVELRPIP